MYNFAFPLANVFFFGDIFDGACVNVTRNTRGFLCLRLFLDLNGLRFWILSVLSFTMSEVCVSPEASLLSTVSSSMVTSSEKSIFSLLFVTGS